MATLPQTIQKAQLAAQLKVNNPCLRNTDLRELVKLSNSYIGPIMAYLKQNDNRIPSTEEVEAILSPISKKEAERHKAKAASKYADLFSGVEEPEINNDDNFSEMHEPNSEQLERIANSLKAISYTLVEILIAIHAEQNNVDHSRNYFRFCEK